MDLLLIAIIGVIFLATTVRSAFGFGEALIAVPLLALFTPVQVAAPLAVLVSITVAAVVVAQDWRHIDLAGAWRLVAATFVGIPLGLLLLITAPEAIVKAVLALVIIPFSLHALIRRGVPRLPDDRLAWLFGLAAGILGGAYGMNGPPLVLYGAMRGWSPQRFRATLQGYFLPASIVGMTGYALAGLWTAQVTRLYLLTLPVALAAILLGRLINRRLTGAAFLSCVHIGLIAVGILLLAQSLRSETPVPSATQRQQPANQRSR